MRTFFTKKGGFRISLIILHSLPQPLDETLLSKNLYCKFFLFFVCFSMYCPDSTSSLLFLLVCSKHSIVSPPWWECFFCFSKGDGYCIFVLTHRFSNSNSNFPTHKNTEKSSVEECIFDYIALHIECRFNKNSYFIHNDTLHRIAFFLNFLPLKLLTYFLKI